MATFTRTSRKASRLALAAALMGAGALGVAGLGTPAVAQKKDKQETKAKYSEGFVKAFGPIDEAVKGENPDYAALLTQARAAQSSIETGADRFAFGSTLEKIGAQTKDTAVRREGMEMMLESGLVPPEALPQYTYIAGQLAFNDEDYLVARERVQKALELGYEDPQAETLIAATFTRTDDSQGALRYYAQQINTQVGAGQKPSEDSLKRAFQIAANNDYLDDASAFARLLVEYYPSEIYWANAIAMERNSARYTEAELLDLMRLLRTTGGMSNARDYADYIDAANYRRLPAEVSAVANEGVSAGVLQSGDTFVREAMTESENRISGLRSDLAELERDARASGAEASLALATGDVYLNFDEPSKAAELYEVALSRPGVETATALTRLGIAQVKMGDYAAAQATLDKVDGNRKNIADLWASYAKQQASGSATVAG
ncbi:hypothetical protein [Alteriqipengyuania sp. 357]